MRYVNAKTGLVPKDDSVLIAKGFGSIPLTVRHSDYHDAHAIQMPTRPVRDRRFAGEVVFQSEGGETDLGKPGQRVQTTRESEVAERQNRSEPTPPGPGQPAFPAVRFAALVERKPRRQTIVDEVA